MNPRKPDETDKHYIKRLEDCNKSLQQQNKSLSAWCSRIERSVEILSCNGSLVFQAMAEKARVRSHPSVTKVVEMFDAISHPRWGDGKEIPEVEFPDEWDFDPPGAQSGDADMALNSPLVEIGEILEAIFSGAGKKAELIRKAQHLLHAATMKGVQGIKERSGFISVEYKQPADSKHYRDMSREELTDLVGALSWMALDLAQDISFANEALRRDLRAATYRRVCSDLYRMSQLAFEWDSGAKIDVKVLGGERALF